MNIQAGQVGGVGRVTLHTVSGIDNFVHSATFALGSWVAIFARYDGTNIKMRVNATSSTDVAASSLNAAYSGQAARMAHPTFGMAIHDRLSLITSLSAWTDGECDDQYTNWKFHAFPSTGLP